MATITNFEDLEIWKKSRIVTKQVYEDFLKNKDFGFKDQIQRAAISIMNNIVEGFCRCSDAEFHQFLNFSKGSAGEIKNMYYIAEDLKYLPPDICNDRRELVQGLSNGISVFMTYLKAHAKFRK
jgi:four helix bundle protein